jgi:ABC-2 type transport system permease protein
VEGGVVFAGYLGVYLTGAMFLSAGTFASALTENQIVAALLAFAIIFGLVISGILAESSTRYLGGVFAPFSLRLNLQDFIAGIVDSSGLVYFLSMTGFFIFLTQRSIDSQRWR